MSIPATDEEEYEQEVMPASSGQASSGSNLEEEDQEGSWIPFIVIVLVGLLWWVTYSESRTAVKIRRSMSSKRIQLKKKYGLRDDAKYKEMKGAGDGANQKYKRQG
eukprot:CAMPEP_0113442090 /NCGR_PEP_ID=MMETSP0014_2-20120614/1429_1 /TAXON_ID=2857 /ORGANISM="Nitzschia sp." /LENGTH=105 /DNA_ID=CAMNT_0000332975 /DNA_START=554 /DNA_END=871 /DNA_ORIENTATION=- /assembly_acc=CAM_ASM_000159